MEERRRSEPKRRKFEPRPDTGAPVSLPTEDLVDPEEVTQPIIIEPTVTLDDDPTATFFALEDHRKPVLPGAETTIPKIDDEDIDSLDEITELTAISAPAFSLHEIVNQLKVLDRLGEYPELDRAAELEAAQFTSVDKLKADANIVAACDELRKAVAGESFSSSAFDTLSAHLKLSSEDIQAVVKSANEIILERARQQALQVEAAAMTKSQIAKKILGYGSIGIAASIATGGLASIAALTIGRFTENLVKGSERDKATQANYQAELTKLKHPTQATADEFTSQVMALLAERKQRQLDNTSQLASSSASVLTRLQEAFLYEKTQGLAVCKADVVAATHAVVPDATVISMCVEDLKIAERELAMVSEAMSLDVIAEQIDLVLHIEDQQREREAAQVSRFDGLLKQAKRVKERFVENNGSVTEQNVTTALFAMASASAMAMPGVRKVLGAITGYRLGSMLSRRLEQGLTSGSELMAKVTPADSAIVRATTLASIRERIAQDKQMLPAERSQLQARVQELEADLITSGQLTHELLTESATEVWKSDQKHFQEEAIKRFALKAWGGTLGFFIPDAIYAARQHLPELPSFSDEVNHSETAPVTAEAVTPPVKVPEPVPTASLPVTTEPVAPAVPLTEAVIKHIDDHAVNERHVSISAATQHDVPRSVWLKTIHTTEVSFPDGPKKLWDPTTHTGLEVRPGAHLATEIIPDSKGGGVMHYYDTDTHREIPPDQVHHYLQEAHYSESNQRLATELPEHGSVRVPEAEDVVKPHIGVEDSQSYIARGLREFVSTHEDYNAFHILDDRQLIDQPLLQNEVERLAHEYYAASLDHADAAVTASTERGGGDVQQNTIAPAEPVSKPTAVEHSSVVEGGKLSAEQTERFSFDSHRDAAGHIESYSRYQSEIKGLLELDKNHRVTSDDRLVFSQRGGELFVEYAGGLRRQGVALTEELFKALASRQHELALDPGYKGKFDLDQFNSVVREVEASR